MGWLSRLFGVREKRFVQLEGSDDFECEVVGESNYQDALERIAGDKTEDGHEHECIALLTPEPTNPHDRNAVVVTIDDMVVGYLSRPHAQAMCQVFERNRLDGAYANAMIVGGWRRVGRRSKDEGHYGVRLDIPID